MKATRTPIPPVAKWIQTNVVSAWRRKALAAAPSVGATPHDQIVVRCNRDDDVMRSFGEDLKNAADEVTAPPERGDTTH